MSFAVFSSPLLRTVFVALGPNPIGYLPAVTVRKRHPSRRRHLPVPGRAAGGTGTCFIMKNRIMIISKRRTRSMRYTRIESRTVTTDERVWMEAFF